MRLSRPRRCIALASAASAWRHPAQEPSTAQRTEGGEPLLDRGMTGLSRDSICHRRLGPATPLGRGGSTTPTSFEGQRLGICRALPARIASGLRRTHGGGGSRLAFGLCRPAPAVLVMARKLRPALVCAPPRRSRRLPHTARLAEGRTEPDFEPAEPNDRAVVVVGRCSCRTRPQCAPTAAFRRAARMCRSNVSRCAFRPSPETPCLSVEARRYCRSARGARPWPSGGLSGPFSLI